MIAGTLSTRSWCPSTAGRFLGKMDEQIIAMYARGIRRTRDIQAFIDDLYGVDIEPRLR